MKLEDFVKQTLLDITNGVESAQKKSVVPIAPASANDVPVSTPQFVSFEIADNWQRGRCGNRCSSLRDKRKTFV
jgi:hypothetical protein